MRQYCIYETVLLISPTIHKCVASTTVRLKMSRLERSAEEHLARSVAHMQGLSEDLEIGSIEWKDGMPVNFDEGAVLRRDVRNRPVRYNATPAERFPALDPEQLFDVFLQEYSSARKHCDETADAMTRESDQMLQKLALIGKEMDAAVGSANRLSGAAESNAAQILERAQAALKDATSSVTQSYAPEIKNAGWRQWLAWPRRTEVEKWSFDDARKPWIESMNVLLSPLETPFRLDEFPKLTETAKRRAVKAREKKLRTARAIVMSRSERHTDALREVIRLSELRIDFFEGGADGKVVLAGTGIDMRGRNVTRALKVLYLALIEFSRVKEDAQANAANFINAVISVTLTLEYFTQMRNHNFHKKLDGEFEAILAAAWPAQPSTGKTWEDWIPFASSERKGATWQDDRAFAGEAFDRFRTIVVSADTALRATVGKTRSQDNSWKIPLVDLEESI